MVIYFPPRKFKNKFKTAVLNHFQILNTKKIALIFLNKVYFILRLAKIMKKLI